MRDVRGVLRRVREGAEVIVTNDESADVVMRPVDFPRRKISEVMAIIGIGCGAVMDESFARDIQSAIDSHREPLDPPAWD